MPYRLIIGILIFLLRKRFTKYSTVRSCAWNTLYPLCSLIWGPVNFFLISNENTFNFKNILFSKCLGIGYHSSDIWQKNVLRKWPLFSLSGPINGILRFEYCLEHYSKNLLLSIPCKKYLYLWDTSVESFWLLFDFWPLKTLE